MYQQEWNLYKTNDLPAEWQTESQHTRLSFTQTLLYSRCWILSFSFLSCLPLHKESERKGMAWIDQTYWGLCVYIRAAGKCLSVCEEQLKSNSSAQVFTSNDLSVLWSSGLTASCRGRGGQGQTAPDRQADIYQRLKNKKRHYHKKAFEWDM